MFFDSLCYKKSVIIKRSFNIKFGVHKQWRKLSALTLTCEFKMWLSTKWRKRRIRKDVWARKGVKYEYIVQAYINSSEISNIDLMSFRLLKYSFIKIETVPTLESSDKCCLQSRASKQCWDGIPYPGLDSFFDKNFDTNYKRQIF